MEELCTYKILNGFDLIRTFDRYVVSIMKPRKVNHKSYVGPLCPHLTQPYKFIFWHHLRIITWAKQMKTRAIMIS